MEPISFVGLNFVPKFSCLKAEVITIGDEILIGQIIDTNSAWLGENLNPLGWEIHRITTIHDTSEEITSAVDEALKRSDLVIMTGGLGPTKDDVTKQTLCAYFNVDLVFDQPSYENIERIFNFYKREVSEVNRNQALIPANAVALHNAFGTAPGMWFDTPNGILVSLPGVPYEMKNIMETGVFPRIEKLSKDLVKHRTIVVSGIPESVISERIAPVEDALSSHLKLAYLPHYNVVRLRISARGRDTEQIENELDTAEKDICAILGNAVVSTSDRPIQEIIGELLTQRQQTVSLAESCTGGYLAHLITSVSGSSAYFPGSVVTYSYDNKTEVLGVDADLLWEKGAVSQEVVEKMCTSVMHRNNTDFGLAVSGIAGPGGGTTEKPVGTVWMAVCDRESVVSKLYHVRGNRTQNIERSANLALELLRKKITGLI